MRYVLFIIFTCATMFAFSSCHHNNNSLKIAVQESGDTYKFYAYFPEEKTNKVHRVINKNMEPNALFASADDHLDVTTSLQDKTNFAVKASPGIVEITVHREGNSQASYDRVKDMCASIKEALKD